MQPAFRLFHAGPAAIAQAIAIGRTGAGLTADAFVAKLFKWVQWQIVQMYVHIHFIVSPLQQRMIP